MKKKQSLNIGFVSTRFAGTDGVSLEATKWADVLAGFGHQAYWFAGIVDKPPQISMVVPEAFFNTPENLDLNEQIYGSQFRSRAITDEIHKRKERLKDALYQFISDYRIDMLIAENCLSIPMQIPLGIAVAEVIAETKIPTIGHHHDFWWERNRFLLNSARDIIQSAFPPDLPSIRHVVINSIIQSDLAAKRGISSLVVFNVIDFEHNIHDGGDHNNDFRESFGFNKDDLLILQPTRVVSRKGIEQALYLVKRLDMDRVKFLISHSPGDEGDEYYEWLIDTAKNQDIDIHFLHNRLHDTRKTDDDGNKVYTLWDVYPHVDLVTYPSLYEGFGNAFLEAVLYKKPVLVNRYSVYIVDIEPKGFDVVAIDGFITNKAVQDVRDVLQNDERRLSMVEKNFEIGKRFFSYGVLRRRLSAILSGFYGEL